MNDEIIIIGSFHEIIELAEANGCKILGLIDNQKTGVYRHYKILGDDSQAIKQYLVLNKYPIILSPDLPSIRKKLFDLYSSRSFNFYSLLSKRAFISSTSKIGNGTIIQSGVNISAEVEIGNFTKINTNANIMHNSIIGNFSTIAPNAVVLGNISIGNNCYLGANSTILPNLEICEGVTIGAGAVVTKSIKKQGIYIGNPAKELYK